MTLATVKSLGSYCFHQLKCILGSSCSQSCSTFSIRGKSWSLAVALTWRSSFRTFFVPNSVWYFIYDYQDCLICMILMDGFVFLGCTLPWKQECLNALRNSMLFSNTIIVFRVFNRLPIFMNAKMWGFFRFFSFW